MRRKKGDLVPLERELVVTLLVALRDDVRECHGFQIAKLLQDGSNARLLTAHGTLYRALGRLETMGLVESRWEDPLIAARDGRPVRRLYRLTDAGSATARRVTHERGVPGRHRKLARA